jgi:hypothetical protein
MLQGRALVVRPFLSSVECLSVVDYHASQLQRTEHSLMKTATIPSLRVDPELRAAAESVLQEGETLSAFVENSLRAQIHYRKTQAEFIARGLKAREEAKRTGIYYGAEEVLAELKGMLDAKLAEKSAK